MDSNKRLKSASGAPIATSSPAASLPQYQPPATVGAPRPSSSRPTASISRGANGSSLKLKVKAPSSKLKQVTGASDGAIPPNPYAELSESDATPQPAGRAARQTRNPRTVVEPDTDDDEDMEDAEGEEQDEDDDMEDEEEDVEDEQDDNEGSEEDAEGEDEEDDEMGSDEQPPPPIIKQERPVGKAKPNVTVTAPPEGPLKSVEEKEMEDEDDEEEEEELSELESNPDADEEEEEDDDSDEDLDNSRSATPDLSKLTKRQRGAVVEAETEGGLMELSNEAQKKKHLTAEEQVMRRAEMARRRKNLSEKRNEEEKMDTINKLLKKPAPKRRTRAEIIAQQQADMMATPSAEEGEEERPDPLFVRWVNSAQGSRVGVPEEWMEAAVGDVFRGPESGKMVEEVA